MGEMDGDEEKPAEEGKKEDAKRGSALGST
jgi:hypothetical protein